MKKNQVGWAVCAVVCSFVLITHAAIAQAGRRNEGRQQIANGDIVAMVNAGLSREVIVAKIRTSPAIFDLGTSDLIRLKALGVAA